MGASVRWSGLDELKAELRRLPDALVEDATDIVVGSATNAEIEIRNAYPVRSGELRSGMQHRMDAIGRFGVRVRVMNTAWFAMIFENGSQTRKSRSGTPSPLPPGHVFVPRIHRHRRAMYDRLKAMLVRHGLTVSGDA